MRAARNVALLHHEGAPAYGVILCGDYCGQHEAGVDGINQVLGISIPRRPQGIGSRTATNGAGDHARIWDVQVDAAKVRRQKGPRGKAEGRKPALPRWATCRVLTLHRYDEVSDERILADAFRNAPLEGGRQLAGEWDGDGFVLYAYDEVTRDALTRLAEALDSGDMAVWLGGATGNPFDRAGLILAIASRIPACGAELMAVSDKENNALLDASEATGIAARLAAADAAACGGGRFAYFNAKFGYHALSPRWRNEGDPDSAHPVVYFLNPRDQANMNYGWFTVEDLDAWMAGRGPVPKKQAEPAPAPADPVAVVDAVDDRQGNLAL